MTPFPYTLEAADYTPQFPDFEALDVVNETQGGVAVEDTFNVPAAADGEGRYRYNLSQRPLDAPGLTVTVDGDSRTVVPYGEAPAAGEVAVSFVTGAVEFHSSDAGLEALVGYTGGGTPLMGYLFHAMSAEIAATQTAYAAGGGPVKLNDFATRMPRVLYVSTAGNDTTGNGSVAAPYATLAKALTGIAASVVVRFGPGSFTYAAPTNGGTDPFLLTPAFGIFLEGVAGQTVLTITGDDSGPGVHNVLTITAARGMIFDRSGSANRITICGLDQQLGLVDCEVRNTDSEGLRVYGRTNESAPLVRYKQGTLTGDLYLANVWIKDSIISTNKLVMDSDLGTASRGYVNRITDSIITVASSGTFECDLASAHNVTILASSVSVFSLTLVSDDPEAVYTDISGKVGGTFSAGSGLISYSPSGSNASVLVDRLQFRYTGTFAEGTDGGKVAVLTRFQGAEPFVIRDSWIESTGICVFNSHPNPAIDSGRTSQNRPLDIINSTLLMVRAATAGTADNNAPFLNYGAGNVRSIGNRYVATLAASTKTDTHYSAIYCSTEDLAANCVFLSKDDRFEVTLPAGAIEVAGSGNNEKAVFIFNDGDDDMLDAVVINPSISVDGNQNSVFSGLGSTKVTVLGVVSCNATVTYQNAPAGGFQAVRGDMAISGNITAANLSGTNTGDVAAANPSGTVGLSAVNGAAATYMRSDGAPALSQAITPTWMGAHVFSVLTSLAGVKAGYRSVSSAATVAPATDCVIMQTGTSITQEIPTTGVATGQLFIFAASRSGGYDRAIVLDPEGGATIGGASTWTLSYPGEAVLIQFDGTNYQVLAQMGGVTGTVSYLDPDSTPRVMNFEDGLLVFDSEI